ncbi:protein bark beetle isoform X2 [Anthonomus grandis grandis]|uniref:protein bark beetle isoform X2 n=1 Tax=Anthonomus grandis grandis TaxID=2921223 RepID=UPI0021666462|nr:protein bark beetle isoform X2 [Anthonomus grandis grandis]
MYLTRTFYFLTIFCSIRSQNDFTTTQEPIFENSYILSGDSTFSETSSMSSENAFSGGTITNRVVFERSRSPYWIRDDIIVERSGELVLEPGVTVKLDPQVGVTVRGVLDAQGTEDDRIIFTTSDENKQSKSIIFPEIRLVDGPSILAGRVQIKVNDQWRSVCTNSKNWTTADTETACRQLGFQGGKFFQWFNRQMPLKPRVLYEEPKCTGTESSLSDCSWSSAQMGSGVCDYHPDIGIECLTRHDTIKPYWRGIRFEYAQNENYLTLHNTLFTPSSLSVLRYVDIYYAGVGRDHNTSSAIHVEGVPPLLENVEIVSSAYNGVNITNPGAPIVINNCTIRNNRGYGIFVNSSFGLTNIDGCVINDNGGDGVRYIKAEKRPDESSDRRGYSDFCQVAVISTQVFPIYLYAEQTDQNSIGYKCNKGFATKYGQVITLDFDRAVTNRNNSALLEIYDGSDLNNRLLQKISIRNNTRPQSMTTTSHQIFIKFQAEPYTNTVLFLRLMSGHTRSYDLNVSRSDVSDNVGRGIAVDNLRSQVHIHKTSISKNEHVAGVHITSGVGDINITESRISFNEGDGVNITYSGGSRNISKSSLSSNKGYGIAIWLNDTKETEFLFINQTSVVQYTEIYKNLEIGVLHGNYCGPAFFNFTGNSFTNCASDALEILSCWKNSGYTTQIQVGHNKFIGNEKIALKIYPAVNLQASIEYNHFRQGTFGALLIKNKPLEEFNVLSNDIVVQQNYFLNNSGVFVVNLALSPYSEGQYLLFTRNFVKNNRISEPFQPLDGSVSNLNPRSRVAAPIVIGSSNIEVFRNIIENPNSKYEIGSHLEDQSKIINATYNWLGAGSDEFIYHRIFHRFDRYNLAKITFVPFLLHNSNPLTTKINPYQLYVPKFSTSTSDKVGGEIEGEEILSKGEYVVERDISIRPGGKLTIEPGVTLRFPPSIGMMVGGRLEARGIEPDSIQLTMKENVAQLPEDNHYESEAMAMESETEIVQIEPQVPIRLLGGTTETEGRLQIKIKDQWGTVCNYGWTIQNAALVCQQLGYVLNPEDWYIERNEIPDAGRTEPVILSNVDCQDYDLDITKCKAESKLDFLNSCGHENDVGVRCYKTSWAGVRFGALAERSDLQYVTIEQSGLLDYATNTFKPALQLDFAKQNFENIRIIDNFYHGLGVMFSNIYTDDSVNIIKNSEFLNNKGSGISLKQLGFTLYNNKIENNFIGIEHNPTLSGQQQRELAGWFIRNDEETYYKPLQIPDTPDDTTIEIQRGETTYLVTSKINNANVQRSYRVQCEPGWVIGIQLLNPIENRSTENIIIYDSISRNPHSDVWILKRDLSVFPTTSSAHTIIMDYASGTNSFGGTVIILSAIRAPVQNVYKRRVKGPVPTLSVKSSIIRNNMYGIYASYYNRYLDELGNHFLRPANESMKFINCEITHNIREAVFVHSPNWDLHNSNLSEITLMVNKSIISDNGKGFYQFSRDMRSSNNLFHYVLQDNTIERNKGDGFNIALPYVWEYNENFTHSVYMDNNSFINNRNFGIDIDGHFAEVNLTSNVFKENRCHNGLLTVKGMEKKMLILSNKFLDNNCKYVVLFSCNSQSEIIGNIPAVFLYNELRNNKYVQVGRAFGILQKALDPKFLVGFKGIQKVTINRNLFASNSLEYDLLAGIKTAKIDEFLNVRENWWGTTDENHIQSKIFDFDDWNDHAVAIFRPFLIEEDFQASFSLTFNSNLTMDVNNLKGRLYQDLTLTSRHEPYVIQSDLTVMPNVTLTIHPGVTMEFSPNIGILVLGTLQAEGIEGNEIVMRPVTQNANLLMEPGPKREKRELELMGQESIRLCKNRDCSQEDEYAVSSEGFLEWFNQTTLQWIPMCDPRFTERNAQVVCTDLGFDPLNAFFDFGQRIDFHSNSLSRIWTWPEPLQCKGTEKRFEDCPIRLNGQQFGHRHKCEWNSNFVFINCNNKAQPPKYNFWGGVRFAEPDFEQRIYSRRVHDVHTHSTMQETESVLRFVKIHGAGILHNEKSPAVQSIIKSPKIEYVEVTSSASHGINLISPSGSIHLRGNTIQDSLGVGINVASLSGEGRESEESSFTPLREMNIPYNLYGLLDICDTNKEVVIEERVLVYYKYDNHPVNCIKIFRSAYNIKPLGLRFLQFNLFNSSVAHGIPDFVSVYDGDIYNISSRVIDTITMTSSNQKNLFRTRLPSLSVKLFANGASSNHGFIAEVVTLPIAAIAFSRDVQHNVSSSVISNNTQGAILYMGAGEVNPIITIERNQFKGNCKSLYGNFTTCKSAIEMDVQNTQTVFFRSNLVEQNQGGLYIKADSRGSATSLQGWIYNNLFANNSNLPTLYVEGRKSSPYQEVTIYRNYFTRNVARYHNNIVLKQVLSNFTYNFVKRNIGQQNVEISGFDKVRLNIYQTTTHNGFYHNYALKPESKSTIVAGTAGQHYVDNIFFNPDNDYEIITVNRSLTLQLWNTKIDASYNYWGFNTTLAVRGRIRDQMDDPRLLEVTYEPFYMNNQTILNGKCPPGWELVGETCYMYIGAPMTYWEAKAFCQADNASMPYLMGNINYLPVYEFLRRQYQWYLYSDRVWIQHIDNINQCTIFAYQTVEIDDCNRRSPFICEIDPKVSIKIQPLADDLVSISIISSLVVAVLLIIIVLVFWWYKSKYRQAQRLERRNSIRQSLHSLKSVGLSSTSFADPNYRKKMGQLSSRSTDTLTKASDYKKIISNGSIDSMEKSAYNSSIEDDQSYNTYETHNPTATFPFNSSTLEYHKSPNKFENQYAKPTGPFDLAFKNEGFKDNSTFATNSNYQSQAGSVHDGGSSNDETPIIQPYASNNVTSYPPSNYYNTDTLPLRDISEPSIGLIQELKSRWPKGEKPPTPPRKYSPTYSDQLAQMHYTPDYNSVGLAHPHSASDLKYAETKPSKVRAKSEVLLETNFDYNPKEEPFAHQQPLGGSGRWKSQPLETAM